jgi:hypothetical protein
MGLGQRLDQQNQITRPIWPLLFFIFHVWHLLRIHGKQNKKELRLWFLNHYNHHEEQRRYRPEERVPLLGVDGWISAFWAVTETTRPRMAAD